MLTRKQKAKLLRELLDGSRKQRAYAFKDTLDGTLEIGIDLGLAKAAKLVKDRVLIGDLYDEQVAADDGDVMLTAFYNSVCEELAADILDERGKD